MNRPINGMIIYNKQEHELDASDYSVTRLLAAAREKGVKINVVKPQQFEMVVTRVDRKSILIDDKPFPLPDFVLPRLGASTSHYAFSVLRQLQGLGVYVCNDADSIAAVKDKLYMYQALSNSKLATPKTMLAKYPISSATVEREIGFPLIIKNVSGMRGAGIYLCDSKDKFEDILELVYSNNENANMILQEFVQASYGKDLRVFVVGGRVLGCMVRSSSGSFKSNFSRGGTVEEYELNPELVWLATDVAKLFNLDIAGVDILFERDGYKVCEANSAPGFKGLEQITGPNIAEGIIDYILVKIGCSLDLEHVV